MRSFWSFITVALGLIGFFIPIAWMGAFVTAVLAIGSTPAGRRADGKRKTGGLLGGAWDAAVVASKTKDCQACLAKIPREARRCQHCGEAQEQI